MGARTKLNQFFVQGALIGAALIGVVAESWAVFLAAAAIFIAIRVYSGDIRPDRRR